MLIRFRVDNHRSLCFEQVLSLAAEPAGAADDQRPRQVPGHSKRLLPAVAIYGPNASGKSNLLAALGYMREAVTDSHRFWSPDEGVPRDPFAWGGHADRPSLYEVAFIAGGVRYVYGFKLGDERVLEEWVFAWPRGRKQKWLWREGTSYQFGDGLKGENRRVEHVTRPNALFLSTAVQYGHTQLGVIYRWFRSLRSLYVEHISQDPRFETKLVHLLRSRHDLKDEKYLFPDSDASFQVLLNLLRAADLGIEDLRLARQSGRETSGRPRRDQILLRHSSSDPDAWLPMDEESEGTRNLLRLAQRVLDTLHVGRVLIVDDLEANLHPLLVIEIVRLFNSPDSNPERAQLVFTSHATSLLGVHHGGEPLLRRDQVWFTAKDALGATTLTSLASARPQRHEDIERGYLLGRFGAVPELDPFG